MRASLNVKSMYCSRCFLVRVVSCVLSSCGVAKTNHNHSVLTRIKKQSYGFSMSPARLLVVGNGSRGYLSVFAILNSRARATNLGQGPHLHRSVHAGLLRAPQPKPREKTGGRKSKNVDMQKNSMWYEYRVIL